jgi:hypothetical protein
MVIESERFQPHEMSQLSAEFRAAICSCDDGRGPHSRATNFHIHTLEGPLHVSPGDMVIRGTQGEFYPCKPEIFEMIYEPVDDRGEMTNG